MEWQFSCLDQCRNLARKVGADTGNLVDLVRAHLGDRDRLVANRACRVAVGAHAKEVFAAKLQHFANIIEHLGDLVILHHRYFRQMGRVTRTVMHWLSVAVSSTHSTETETETVRSSPTWLSSRFESPARTGTSSAFPVGVVADAVPRPRKRAVG